MRAGRLKTRITVERDATEAGPSGGKKAWTTPETVCTIWSEMKAVGGAESFGNPDWITSVVVYTFMVRYRADITPKMRIRYDTPHGTRYFGIVKVPLGPTSDDNFVIEAQEVV